MLDHIKFLTKDGQELAGLVPYFMSDVDPRSAAAQLDASYAHGGGWRPMPDWSFDIGSLKLKYPGDPALKPVAWMKLRDETIYIYPHAWVCIVQADGAYEVARMD